MLYLASTSRYRQALLARLGLPFTALDPACDEAEDKARGLPPEDLVLALAHRKAASVAARIADGLVIGADQVAAIDGEVLGKPGTRAAAEAQLARLAGRTHRLITGLAVHDASTGRREAAVDVHALRMRPLHAAQIARYVAADDPLDCAGAYKIESLGVALFERTEGEDFTAIVGLPLMRLVALLARFGVEVP